MPRASIIVPVCNAARFLPALLESIAAQTMSDFECFLVDDGSTDDSRSMLESYAARDARFRVIAQDNRGEGPARNAALPYATGAWLYFLDADDLMEPTLLAEAIARGEQTEADIVIFRTRLLDDVTGEVLPADWAFQRHDGVPDVFAPETYAVHLFDSFQNWVWNKLFRRSFIEREHLAMQPVRRTADLLFTCSALVSARRIALLDRSLHRYRVNNPQSAMATSDVAPLDFYQAFLALRTFLEKRGVWDIYRVSFENWAIGGFLANLDVARTLDSYRAILTTYQAEGFERLGISELTRAEAFDADAYDRCAALRSAQLVDAIFADVTRTRGVVRERDTALSWSRLGMASLEERVQGLKAELERCQGDRDCEMARADALARELEHVRTSISFRLGCALTVLPRACKRALRR